MSIQLPRDVTVAIKAAYEDVSLPTDFLSSLFFDNEPTNSNLIQLDIRRGKNQIAVDVIPCTGPNRKGKNAPYTTKTYKPPGYKEADILSACDMEQRQYGKTEDEQFSLNANFAADIVDVQMDTTNKVLRAIEVQARDALVFGQIFLINGDNIDFKRKPSHEIAAVTPWSNPAADIFADFLKAGTANKKDGKISSNLAIMGEAAFGYMLQNTDFIQRANFRRVSLVDISTPLPEANGANFNGTIAVGPYIYQIWVYPEFYEVPLGYGLPNEGEQVPYIPDDKVIVTSDKARFDKYWAGIYRFGDTNRSGVGATGVSIAPIGEKARMAPFAYFDDDMENLTYGVRSRPLCVPTAIDAISVITTV